MLLNNLKCARADAANETGISNSDFPDTCPYSLEEIQSEWFPEG